MGWGEGTWEDRPCHNLLYPEIAVPLELHSPFSIQAGTNQSIWGDIYIPKTTPAHTWNRMAVRSMPVCRLTAVFFSASTVAAEVAAWVS